MMKPTALIFVLLLKVGCYEKDMTRFGGNAQGTTFHVTYWSENSISKKEVKRDFQLELDRIDKELSNYRPDSTIEEINAVKTTMPFEVSKEIFYLLSTAKHVNQESEQCYDITIKPLYDLWGFSTSTPDIPSVEKIDEELQKVGMNKLSLNKNKTVSKNNPRIQIDLSSIAQGYTLQRLADLLNSKGIESYLIELGGEMVVKGHKPSNEKWKVGIESPISAAQRRAHKILDIGSDQPMAVMTSGTYRHFYDEKGKRYSHVIDARTGWPVEHDTVSVTVVHDNPTLADAWSTALLCLGSKKGKRIADKHGLAAYFIAQKGDKLSTIKSEAFSRSF